MCESAHADFIDYNKLSNPKLITTHARYLHIPHTPDTARTLTLSGRNCLVVSGMKKITLMEIPVTLVPSIDAQAWSNEIYVDKEYRLIPIDSL